MNYKSTVCQACLSTQRELCSMQKLQNYLEDEDLRNLNLIYSSDGGVCWECKRVIVKLSRFKKQVELAQKYLLKEKHHAVKCLSSLSCSPTETHDYQGTYTDPLVPENVDVEPKKIKQEDSDVVNTDLFDTDDNTDGMKDCDNETVDFDSYMFVEETEIKKEVAVKKKVKKIAKNSVKNVKVSNKLDESVSKVKEQKKEDVGEKFVEVTFTEEEMLRNREEKRSHPNFKKLPYNCDTCVLGFTRKETYDLHIEKKHNESIGPDICPVCQIRFTTSASLTKHVYKHYHCYRCKLCTYETTELWSVVGHCRTKHSGDSEDCIHCQQCSYVAKTREELAEHKKTQHVLICNECGEKFKRPNTLKTHIRRIHGSVREHKCPTCPKAFSSLGRLEVHMAGHDSAAAARLAYCALCRVQYKNIYVYRNHLSTSAQHNQRRYHCQECNKKFASKVYYKRHYTFYHQKSSPFKCELCNRLFISDWRLRNHRQMQHGLARSRNHTCNICGKKFFTTATLKAHQLTHSSARTFMCEDCGDTFKQRPALYTHTRLVHRTVKRHA